MYSTQVQQLKKLNAKEYEVLRKLCNTANNMYNVALYNLRQEFFKGKVLSYESNYKLCKINENYKILNSNMAQQIIKEASNSFSSFLGLLKLKKKGSYNEKVKIPNYKTKNGFSSLKIQQVQITDRMLLIPMSRSFKKNHNEIKIRIPKNVKPEEVKFVEIKPICNAKRFSVHWVLDREVENTVLDENKFLGIDLGIDNLLTCATNDGKAFIIDGKKLKSINQYVNKKNAKLQSLRMKQKNNNSFPKTTKGLDNLWKFRNHYVNNYIHKACIKVINFCLEYQIGNIVLGYNDSIQKNSNIGKINNQNFVNIPIGKIKHILEFLCMKYGINFIEQEESYTSKASFFDNDIIPVYQKNNNTNYVFSGKRIKRGLYITKDSSFVNADVNAALNILRKAVNQNSLNCLFNIPKIPTPMRIHLIGV